MEDYLSFSIDLGMCVIGESDIQFQWSEPANGDYYELIVSRQNETVLSGGHELGTATINYQDANLQPGDQLIGSFRRLDQNGLELSKSAEFYVNVPNDIEYPDDQNQTNPDDQNQTAPEVETFSFGSLSIGNNWYESDWFGAFFEFQSGWIYHMELGWIYLPIWKTTTVIGSGQMVKIGSG